MPHAAATAPDWRRRESGLADACEALLTRNAHAGFRPPHPR